MPAERGRGAVEAVHPLRQGRPGLDAAGEGDDGRRPLRDGVGAPGEVGLGPFDGHEVAGDGGGALRRVEGGDPGLVRGGIGDEGGRPGPGAEPTAARGVAGPAVGERRLGQLLGAAGGVGVGHRRGERRGQALGQCVEPGRQGVDGEVGERPARLARRRHPARVARVGQGVLETGEVGGERGAGPVQPRRQGAAVLGEPVLDVAVDVDVEEPLEHLPPLLGGGPEEGREVALGQHDDLGELRQAHAEHVEDDVGDLVVAGAHGAPAAVGALLEQRPWPARGCCRRPAAWGAATRGSG